MGLELHWINTRPTQPGTTGVWDALLRLVHLHLLVASTGMSRLCVASSISPSRRAVSLSSWPETDRCRGK